MIDHSISVRDVVQAPTAGAVAVASSAYYITNPVYSLVIGSVAGIVQVIGQHAIQKRTAKTSNITNTFSFILFGVQGIIGSVFAAGFRSAQTNIQDPVTPIDGLTIDLSDLPLPVFGFIGGLISAGIGMLLGVILGLLFILSAKH